MVHRLLAASLKLIDLPESSKDRDSVKGLADNLNVRHRNAQMAGRASVELHTLIYFKNRTVLADARITKVPFSFRPTFPPLLGLMLCAFWERTRRKGTLSLLQMALVHLIANCAHESIFPVTECEHLSDLIACNPAITSRSSLPNLQYL